MRQWLLKSVGLQHGRKPAIVLAGFYMLDKTK